MDQVVDTLEEFVVPAVLLRPDGHVVWAGDERDGLTAALTHWYGGSRAGSL